MRHVSRTHRVALDWMFDRINLDPKIQIRYADTKHQLADTLTKGNFTCDELYNLNISHFRSICCSQNFSSTSCLDTIAKRMQEEKKENIKLWQSQNRRWTWSRMLRQVLRKCKLHRKVRAGKLVAREPNQDAASSSQVWQKDAEIDKSTRRLVAAGNWDIDGIGTKWPHNLQISTTCVSHLEKVLSSVGQRYGRKPGDKMEDLDVNTKNGECLCPLLFKLQFILGKTMQRTYTPSKISLSEHWIPVSM